MLDIESPVLSGLVGRQGWLELAEDQRIGAVYAFVRNAIPFGYNDSDDMSASAMLVDGYGQCHLMRKLMNRKVNRIRSHQ